MKKYIWLLLALFLACSIAQGCSNPTVVIEGYGDLYVLHNQGEGIQIIGANSDGSIFDTTFTRPPHNLRLRYHAVGEATNVAFELPLHSRIKHSWRQTKPEKTLVISDLHGRLDAFAAFLRGNGVVDDELNWIYAKNQLVILGDMLDRGRDDNGIVWLVYKLEKEAEDAGGRVNFLLGNHEDMVLKDDIRYVNEEHLLFAAKAGIPYSELYGPKTQQGDWIRDKYLVLVVGENLFVHAGLSLELTQADYKIGEMNELALRFVGDPTGLRSETHARNKFLFGRNGPFWYRGLVFGSESYPPITSDDLDKVLLYYGVKRIVVGHSEVDEIDRRYEGRVIAVNVRHYDNYPKDRTAGLLIEEDKLFSTSYSGRKVLLSE